MRNVCCDVIIGIPMINQRLKFYPTYCPELHSLWLSNTSSPFPSNDTVLFKFPDHREESVTRGSPPLSWSHNYFSSGGQTSQHWVTMTRQYVVKKTKCKFSS